MKTLFSLEQYTKIFPRLKNKGKLSKSSQFGKKLIESRKIRTFYGKPSQKYLQTLYKKNNCPSQLSFSFFRLLESRLDVVLYRAHFFESIASAKQQISIGKIEVNNKKVVSPGYTVLPGDIIRVSSQQQQVAQTEPNTRIVDTKPVVSLKDDTKNLPDAIREANGFVNFVANNIAKRTAIKNIRKEGSWRFQSSFFLLSIFAKHFVVCEANKKKSFSKSNTLTSSNQSFKKSAISFKNQIADFKRKAIINPLISRLSKVSYKEFSFAERNANLLKTWCSENRFLFLFLSCLRKDNIKKSVRQTLMKVGLQRKKRSESPFLSSGFLPETKNQSIEKETNEKQKNRRFFKATAFSNNSIDDFSTSSPTSLLAFNQNSKHKIRFDYSFFSSKTDILQQILKKEEKSKNSSALFGFVCSANKKQTTKHNEKYFLENTDLLDNIKKPVEISSWLFLNFVIFLKKQMVSTKKKYSCFFSQKNKSFFKEQSFFNAKKTKPLHLEISYRSRSIIFLFPPQRVCFPSFIDLAQIYK